MSEMFDWQHYQIAFCEAAMAAGFMPTLLADLESGPLVAWERPSSGPRIYLSAGIHGDEPAGPLALLELMCEGFFTPAVHWSLCPALNPYGLTAVTRENANGVDLNRDYWQRATLEVVAHALWLDARPAPELFISLHEDWESKGFYFYEINLGADEPQRARLILEAVSPWFPPESGPEIDGHELREAGWIYHAAEPDPTGRLARSYLSGENGLPSFIYLRDPQPSQAGPTRRCPHGCGESRVPVFRS